MFAGLLERHLQRGGLGAHRDAPRLGAGAAARDEAWLRERLLVGLRARPAPRVAPSRRDADGHRLLRARGEPLSAWRGRGAAAPRAHRAGRDLGLRAARGVPVAARRSSRPTISTARSSRWRSRPIPWSAGSRARSRPTGPSTGLPLTLLSPLLALQYGLDAATLATLAFGLALGTPLLSLLGAACSALTLGARGGGVLLALLALPLFVPVLIFGAGAAEAQASGLSPSPHLSLLGAGLIVRRNGAADRRVRRHPHRARLNMNWFYFSSPPTFYRLAGSLAPWFFALAALLAVAGLYVGFLVAPDRRAARRGLSRDLHPRARGVDVDVPVLRDGLLRGALSLTFNTRLAAMMARAVAPTGRDVHVPRALDRRLLGPAHLGHLLGLGRAHGLGARAALPLRRIHRARQRLRGPAPRRSRRIAAGARGPREPADHLFLGPVVEYAAPGLEREVHRYRRCTWPCSRRCCS